MTAPELQARRESDATWKIWCPHCRAWHIHGAVAGHRVAHCADGPYVRTGYVLLAPEDALSTTAATA